MLHSKRRIRARRARKRLSRITIGSSTMGDNDLSPRQVDAKDWQYLLERIEGQQADISDLMARVATLEAGKGTKGPKVDERREAILAFVNTHPGMKLTALVVAENLDMENTLVGHKMRSLWEGGHIGATKEDGRTRMYFALPKTED